MNSVWIFYTNHNVNDYIFVKPFSTRDKAIEYMLKCIEKATYITLSMEGDAYREFMKYRVFEFGIRLPRKQEFMYAFEYEKAYQEALKPLFDRNDKRIEQIKASGYFTISHDDESSYEWIVQEYEIE